MLKLPFHRIAFHGPFFLTVFTASGDIFHFCFGRETESLTRLSETEINDWPGFQSGGACPKGKDYR